MNLDIVYTPKELNNELLNYTKEIATEYTSIKMKGDLVDCKMWKWGGMSFKLINNKESFECKVWLRDGLPLDKVCLFENNNVTISGYLTAELFYGHKFIFNVTEIEHNNKKTKLKTFKEECEAKGFFLKKKKINWDKINKIGLISKIDTQGYTDFIEQLKVPLNIELEEITLEGKDTVRTCMKAINNLQENDIIIIIRGGGNTSEISNSFDNIELFEEVKKSNIPIITAIGHEKDKGDKLLITEVSDYNFHTPSTAAIDINTIILNPIINKINNYLNNLEDLITTNITNDYNKLYNKLIKIYNIKYKEKFTAPIIKLNKDDKYIIIEREGTYYKVNINYNDIMNISNEDIKNYDKLKESILNKNLENLEKYLLILKFKNTEINNIITDIKKVKKIEENFENIEPKLIKSLYCKNVDISKLNLSKHMKLYCVYLYYNKLISESKDITQVYSFLKS